MALRAHQSSAVRRRKRENRFDGRLFRDVCPAKMPGLFFAAQAVGKLRSPTGRDTVIIVLIDRSN
jgi:hypothetical protein